MTNIIKRFTRKVNGKRNDLNEKFLLKYELYFFNLFLLF